MRLVLDNARGDISVFNCTNHDKNITNIALVAGLAYLKYNIDLKLNIASGLSIAFSI